MCFEKYVRTLLAMDIQQLPRNLSFLTLSQVRKLEIAQLCKYSDNLKSAEKR